MNKVDAGVTARMRILMAVFFLTMAFLSQIWGKHYLIKTDDVQHGNDKDGLDMNKLDAKTLINTMFTDEELDGFDYLPVNKQKKIIKDIDKIIENVRYRDMDFNMGVMEDIKENAGGDERVMNGLRSLIKLMPGGGNDYELKFWKGTLGLETRAG